MVQWVVCSALGWHCLLDPRYKLWLGNNMSAMSDEVEDNTLAAAMTVHMERAYNVLEVLADENLMLHKDVQILSH
jgi:hypothetical protein